jgi:hypothetical protein
MVAIAKALAPKDTLELEKSIGWRFGSLPKGAFQLSAAGVRFNKSDFRITVYAGSSKAYYARWQEFGSSQNRAQPYFFPAYRQILRKLRATLKGIVNQAARRAI